MGKESNSPDATLQTMEMEECSIDDGDPHDALLPLLRKRALEVLLSSTRCKC